MNVIHAYLEIHKGYSVLEKIVLNVGIKALSHTKKNYTYKEFIKI